METLVGISDLQKPSVRAWIEQDVLPGYLKSRRWFASKGVEIQAVRLKNPEILVLSTGTVLFTDIDVIFVDYAECYQLALTLHDANDITSELPHQLSLTHSQGLAGPVWLTDAFATSSFAEGLLDSTLKDETIKLETDEFRFRAIGMFDDAARQRPVNVKWLSVEQSNSSLVINQSIIMKFFRRVVTGINPEVEMIRHLTLNGYHHTPALLGEILKSSPDGGETSRITFQRFVENDGDAWSFTLALLSNEHGIDKQYDTFISLLGKRLAELHALLAKPSKDVAFEPVAATATDIALWEQSACQQFLAAVDVLKRINLASPEASASVDFILSNSDSTMSMISELARCGVGSLMTRIHGDFHLGQVLVTKDDAFIIDFEGEPSKPLEARRAKSSPLRDVAGLLRSIDYAGATAQLSRTDFVSRSSDLFLKAYAALEKISEPRWLKTEAQQDGLLSVFLIEKAAYEVCYEAANRPSWINIPIRGLAKIIARLLETAGAR